MVKKRRICFSITSYSLFLYYLLNGINDDDIIICTHNVPKKITKNINHICLPFVTFIDGPKMAPTDSIKGIFENIIGYLRYFYGYFKLRILLFIKCFNKDVEVWGQTHSPFSYMFYKYENAYIIEDGLMNYTWEPLETHKINPIIDFILHMCGIYFLNIRETLGTHKNIKRIYLTQECPFDIIKDKVVTFNMYELWEDKTDVEKEEILKIFNVNVNELRNLDSDYKLLLTQPYCENKMISFEEEIKIYKELLGDSDKIIVKPHPNEKKDHSKIFPNAIIINKEFPIELMELIGINVDDVYTINTTAILHFKNSKIHIYQGQTSSNLINDATNDLLAMLESR